VPNQFHLSGLVASEPIIINDESKYF